MSVLVSPSLLAADFTNLQREIEMINQSEADWLHLDIMDGMFVPNISFGFPVIEAVASICKKPLDVHLMNVHYEACLHLHRTVDEIHKKGMKAGVTLNPSTPVIMLEDIIADLDMVLLMSVNPGFGGQKFITNTLSKVQRLKELIAKSNSKALIDVDGGVQHETAPLLVQAGVDVLVSGSFIFKADDPYEATRYLKHL